MMMLRTQQRTEFSPAEVRYLTTERVLGRIATIDPTGMPHVVPVGWRLDRETGTIEVSGRNFAETRKFRNALVNRNVALVVDDVLPPWRPRSVMVQGTAEAVRPARGEAFIRIVPTRIVSWGLDRKE